MFNIKTLDKKVKQVKSTWSRYKGSRRTYIGVTKRIYVGVLGQRSCLKRIYADNVYNSTFPLLLSFCEACCVVLLRDGGSGYRTYIFEKSIRRYAIDRKGRGRKEVIYLRVANVSYT